MLLADNIVWHFICQKKKRGRAKAKQFGFINCFTRVHKPWLWHISKYYTTMKAEKTK